MNNVKERYINELQKLPSNDPLFATSNGKIFSDSISARAGQWVTGIRVTIGDGLLNSIQFIYDHDPGLSKCHGSSDGKLLEQHFADDEYITKFSWVSGYNTYYGSASCAFTWHVQVTTNKGFYTFGDDPALYYCGNKKTYTIEAEEGHRIVGIRCKARRSDEDASPTDCIGSYGKAVNTLFAISDVYECELESSFTENDTSYNDYYSVINADRLTEIRGAACDCGINKLQFIYDDDDTLTRMHGLTMPDEVPFSFKIDSKTHLVRLYYETAMCDDPKYDKSTFLTYLEFEFDNAYCHAAGFPDEKLPDTFYHKHS